MFVFWHVFQHGQTTVPFFPVEFFSGDINLVFVFWHDRRLPYLRFKLLPEKKRYSRLTGRFFWRVQITTRKNYVRQKKGTVVWPMEAAQIWRECYDQKKKTYRRLAGYVFQWFQITTRKNLRPVKKKVQSIRLTGRFFRRVQITTSITCPILHKIVCNDL